MGKFKENNYQNITFKHLLAFINALKSTNKLVVLYRPTPLLILENGAALGEQAIDFSVLQSSAWKTIQAETATVREKVSLSL